MDFLQLQKLIMSGLDQQKYFISIKLKVVLIQWITFLFIDLCHFETFRTRKYREIKKINPPKMRVLILYILFLNGCHLVQNYRAYMNKNGIVLYHAPDSLLVFYPTGIFNPIFIKSPPSDTFLRRQLLPACYDNNRYSYQSCFILKTIGKNEISVSSVKRCTDKRFNDEHKKFIKIPFEDNNILQDSIRISFSDYITTNVRDIRSETYKIDLKQPDYMSV